MYNMYRALLYFSMICAVHCSPGSKDKTLWIQSGGNVSACCSIKPIPGVEALFINVQGERFGALFGSSSNVRRIDARSPRVKQNFPGWTLDPPEKNGDELCVHNLNGVGLSSNESTIVSCAVVSDHGLGRTTEEELILIKIYTPVAIYASPEPTTVVEGDQTVLTCRATGSPGLHLTWISKKTQQVLNETASESIQGSDGQLNLVLDNVTAGQHGEVYICEAKTTYPTGVAPARAEFVLEVALRPTISASPSVVYTDLNSIETVDITVTGYPVPTVKCENLTLDSGTEIATSPQGGVMLYRLRVQNIHETHLRQFECKAENSFGVATSLVEFTVAPSSPEMLSPSQTKYADYYLLKWRTFSGSLLVNATLNIAEYRVGEGAAGSLKPSSAQNKTLIGHRNLTVALGLHDLDRLKADVWPSPDTQMANQSNSKGVERERNVWQHVTNLTANTEHLLTITVCNQYACVQSEQYEFYTSGDKLVDPTILRLSPRDAEQIADQIVVIPDSKTNQGPCIRVGVVDILFQLVCIPTLFGYITQITC